MKKGEKVVYEKRSQKDYSMSFKLEVVKEIESGLISTTGAQEVWCPSTLHSYQLVKKIWYI